jgi:hypothetical protein
MLNHRGLAIVVATCSVACSGPTASPRVLYSDHLESLDAILTRSGVTLDRAISGDGRGVIRLDSTGPMIVRIAEVRPENAEGVVLTYRGHLRAARLRGRAYLEMSYSVPGRKDLVVNAQEAAVSGTTDWVSQQTRLLLEKGQRVNAVKLNVVVEGTGTVWIGPVLLGQVSY